jgi:hypothetical protein
MAAGAKADGKKAASKGGWRTLAAGGAAGAIDCCFTMPMDTMSTQMQLQVQTRSLFSMPVPESCVLA